MNIVSPIPLPPTPPQACWVMMFLKTTNPRKPTIQPTGLQVTSPWGKNSPEVNRAWWWCIFACWDNEGLRVLCVFYCAHTHTPHFSTWSLFFQVAKTLRVKEMKLTFMIKYNNPYKAPAKHMDHSLNFPGSSEQCFHMVCHRGFVLTVEAMQRLPKARCSRAGSLWLHRLALITVRPGKERLIVFPMVKRRWMDQTSHP